jgi:hypothetical protein
MSPEPLFILLSNALLMSSSLVLDAAAEVLGLSAVAAGAGGSLATALVLIMNESKMASKERGNLVFIFMELITAILGLVFILL